jgi:CheY-like chemotaxis protein
MIHGLALQLKGALKLYSAPDRGTRAELWLPVADGAPPMALAKVLAETVPPVAAKTQRARLLFVEDDFLIGLSTASLLEDLGHSVIRVSSGSEALAVLGGTEAVDLLITDYAMPGMTGMQLAEEARKLRPNLRILLATGYADLPSKAGFDLPRLSKPYRQKELAEHIDAMLA